MKKKKKTNIGKIYLVGAGPGDPGLITVKGQECLKKADVVIYDFLVSPRLLSEAKKDAELIYVGKRDQRHTVEQEKINDLLARKAREGKVVTRLKGGDAFIFGRGGEEALFLAENSIPFEIVPGVSSAYAVPAYAGIPVTQRSLASDVAFITGHEDPAKRIPGIAWEKIATGVSTLVFLMGVKNLPIIVENLLKHGRPPDTPIALIRWGTTPEQETLVGRLDNIIFLVKEKQFKPPAIIVVGKVVSLREKLSWWEKKPLFGQRILVTRARSQAADLINALEELGAEAIAFPTIEIAPLTDYQEADEAIKKLSAPTPSFKTQSAPYDWIVFTSVNGVNYFIERLKAQGKDIRILASTKIAAIGPATAKALEKLHLRVDFVPEDYRAEGVIAEFSRRGVKGKKILIPRAKEAREILPEKLREMGAKVTVAPVYESIPAVASSEIIKKELRQGKINQITFTSSSTVSNFVKILSANSELPKIMSKIKVVAIGPITAKTAEKLGIKVSAVAEKYTIEGLVEAILRKEK